MGVLMMRNATPDTNALFLPEWFKPSDRDVICGWARQNHRHPGNQRFRKLIEHSAPQYEAASSKLAKTQVIAAVVDKVRRDSGVGGFVKRDPQSKRWYEIGDDKGRDKVGHAIRRYIEESKKRKSKFKDCLQKHQEQKSEDSSSSGSDSSSDSGKIPLKSLEDFIYEEKKSDKPEIPKSLNLPKYEMKATQFPNTSYHTYQNTPMIGNAFPSLPNVVQSAVSETELAMPTSFQSSLVDLTGRYLPRHLDANDQQLMLKNTFHSSLMSNIWHLPDNSANTPQFQGVLPTHTGSSTCDSGLENSCEDPLFEASKSIDFAGGGASHQLFVVDEHFLHEADFQLVDVGN